MTQPFLKILNGTFFGTLYVYHILLTFTYESLQKRSKELITKRMQRGLRVITLQGAIEKSPILLSQYFVKINDLMAP